ncbi:MAG: dihydroorotase [Thermodesulfobacteriota bacterium]
MNRLVIKGGRVLDPSTGLDAVCNIYVMGGRVASVKESGADTTELAPGAPGLDLIDASGMLVVPGLVDLHTHLREPGFEYKETIETGAAAAAAGGFSTILCMANTSPVNDNGSVTRYILKKAEATGIRVRPVGALSVGLRGERLTEMSELKEAGCVAVSDDGMPVVNGAFMRRALEYSRAFGLPVISHAEDPVLVGRGVMNEGPVSTRLGLRGIPAAAEVSMVARDIALAELTGGRLHVAHVSTRGAVELIREAKGKGVNITAEATPHHLTLTDEAVAALEGYDTNTKMSPPLRSRQDVDALRAGLKDGTIDCVATDHAPHASVEKDIEFDKAANGIIGLETAFSLVYGLVGEGLLSLSEAVAAMTSNPARAMGLQAGSLRVGSAADIAIFDLDREWTVDVGRLRSRSKNTPYAGRTLKGVCVATIVDGNVVYRSE